MKLITTYISKKTELIRYKFILLLIKCFTPNLYKKVNSIIILSNSIHNIPRPAIKIMKKIFNNKKVKGAEIGVHKGVNAKSILNELNIEKLYLIDTWNRHIHNEKYNDNKIYRNILKEFKDNKRIKIIKDFSSKAIKYIKDNSLDFVYIDANHSYKHVYQDITLYFNKVKNNGIISGHNIFYPIDVLNAVKDFCNNKKINFIIDNPDWYFIKKNIKLKICYYCKKEKSTQKVRYILEKRILEKSLCQDCIKTLDSFILLKEFKQ